MGFSDLSPAHFIFISSFMCCFFFVKKKLKIKKKYFAEIDLHLFCASLHFMCCVFSSLHQDVYDHSELLIFATSLMMEESEHFAERKKKGFEQLQAEAV